MLGNLLIRKNLRSMDCYNQAGGLKLHWDRYSFSGPICWRIFLLPSGNLTVCELENGNLWLVYRLIMVIFHSFLYVYQWVGGRFLWMQNLQELKRRWESATAQTLDTKISKISRQDGRGSPFRLERSGTLGKSNMACWKIHQFIPYIYNYI